MSAPASGQEDLEEVRALEEELHDIMDGFPGEDLGWPITDPETCQELRGAREALERVLDLLRRASNREVPRYEAMAGVLEERESAAIQ